MLKSGLIYSQRLPTGEGAEFKHALVRDTAYESLLREDRQILHLRMAEHLASSGSAEMGVLGRHYAEGGDADRAVNAYLSAAEGALSAAAYPCASSRCASVASRTRATSSR